MNSSSDNTSPGPPSTCTVETPFGRPTHVSIDTFVNALLPPLPASLDLEKLINSVKRFRSPSKQILTRSGRLRGYDKTTPSQLPHWRAFKHLHTCVQRLARALSTLKPNLSFVHNEIRDDTLEDGEEGLPSAYLCSISESHTVDDIDWPSIAVPVALQPEDTAYYVGQVRDPLLTMQIHS